MYNSDIPTRAQLPTSGQLLRSTIIAILAAVAILITIVLPAEYAIDPTGIGRVLGLAEMGKIKTQLADEAERDRAVGQQNQAPAAVSKPDQEVVIGSGAGQSAPTGRTDEMTITLRPDEGTEVKLVMSQGARVSFTWAASGGVVNFDLHGDGGGQATTYERGRGVPGAEGVLEAAFTGNHGWFWRNRSRSDVTVTLRTNGDYARISQVRSK